MLMLSAFKQLDHVLRGDATRFAALKHGQFDTPVRSLAFVTIVLGFAYGICMGTYAVVRTGASNDALLQMLASAVKLPLLFFLTLLITLPSLYVFNALVGSRLSMQSVVRLLIAMLGVMLAVLASFGPIIVFFSVCTESYHFMKLLNVAAAAIAGVLGMAFLLRTLQRLVLAHYPATVAPVPPHVPPPIAEFHASSDADPDASIPDHSADELPLDSASALDHVGDDTTGKARSVFRVWVIVFSLVGAQMSWVLRPFIGTPDAPFTWLRERDSNFFLDVFASVARLFGA